MTSAKNNPEPTFLDFDLLDVPERDSVSAQLRGQNQKKILIVFPCDESKEELEAFLGKIFAAVQLDIKKDAILLKLTVRQRFSFIGVNQAHDFDKVIAFGIDAARMGVQFATPRYQPVQHEGITFLFADDLEAIFEERQAGGKQMSGALWAALKEIFN